MSARRAIESIWNPDDPDSLARVIARARVVVGHRPCDACGGVPRRDALSIGVTMADVCGECWGWGVIPVYANETRGEGK